MAPSIPISWLAPPGAEASQKHTFDFNQQQSHRQDVRNVYNEP